MSGKLLVSHWNLLRKCVFPLPFLQRIRLQELPFRSRCKTYGRAFPPRAVQASPGEERSHSNVLRDWLPIHVGGRVAPWSLCGARALAPAVSSGHSERQPAPYCPQEPGSLENSRATVPDLCTRWELWLSCCSQAENIPSPKMWQSDGTQHKAEGWGSPHAAPPEARDRATGARKGQAEARGQRPVSPSSTCVHAHPRVPICNCGSHCSGRWGWTWGCQAFRTLSPVWLLMLWLLPRGPKAQHSRPSTAPPQAFEKWVRVLPRRKERNLCCMSGSLHISEQVFQ